MNRRLSGTYIRLHQAKEPNVGLGILLILALGAGFLLWRLLLAPPEPAIVQFVFNNALGLTGGDPVLSTGARVGTVDAVRLQPDGRIIVRIAVDPGFRAHPDAHAEILPLNLVGDRYLDYRPGTAGQPLPSGAELAGGGGTSAAMILEAITEQAERLALELQTLARDTVQAELAATVRALREATARVRALPVAAARRDAGVAVAGARSGRARLDTLLAQDALDSAAARFARLRPAGRELAAAAADAQAILGEIQRALAEGEGTIGLLRRDTVLRANLRYIDSVRRTGLLKR